MCIAFAGPVPKNPLDNNNITLVVGSTFQTIAQDPTKDVLLQLYIPWSDECREFAPTYARVAAALGGVPSFVVAKMDLTHDEHPDTIQASLNGVKIVSYKGKNGTKKFWIYYISYILYSLGGNGF